jgi:hypothetical protein
MEQDCFEVRVRALPCGVVPDDAAGDESGSDLSGPCSGSPNALRSALSTPPAAKLYLRGVDVDLVVMKLLECRLMVVLECILIAWNAEQCAIYSSTTRVRRVLIEDNLDQPGNSLKTGQWSDLASSGPQLQHDLYI